MPERNLVGPKYEEETDRGMFYDEDVLEPLLPGDRSLGHLLVRLGKFQSVSEAFHNGWNKPIPTGWNQYEIGTGAGRLALTIWNPSKTAAEYRNEPILPEFIYTDKLGNNYYETPDGEVISNDKYLKITSQYHPEDDGPIYDVGC